MHGNVYEWCNGRWEGGNYNPTDPLTPQSDYYYDLIRRGGCFRDSAVNCRSAYRSKTPRGGLGVIDEDFVDYLAGFRVVRRSSQAVLSSAVNRGAVTKMEGLSRDEIKYIERIMPQLNLTEKEEAAFRLALYGEAGTSSFPKAFSLSQNVPNPFNPSTTISFTVVEGSSLQVTLKVYDIRGSLVRTLVNEVRDAGTYNVFWDGTDEKGLQVASGVYMYRMQAGNFVQTRKMVLLK